MQSQDYRFMADPRLNGTNWPPGQLATMCTLIMCVGSFRFHGCCEYHEVCVDFFTHVVIFDVLFVV